MTLRFMQPTLSADNDNDNATVLNYNATRMMTACDSFFDATHNVRHACRGLLVSVMHDVTSCQFGSVVQRT